jgi:hypothetical protein
MSNLEFIGQLKPKKLTSFEEDFKRSREEFRSDELSRKVRRLKKSISEPLEITYERFPEES